MKSNRILIAQCIVATLLTVLGPESATARPDYSKGLEQARKQAAAGDYAAAEKTLRRLKASNRKNPEILAALARIRLWQRDYSGACRLFRQSLNHKTDASVRRELLQAEALQQLAHADRLLTDRDSKGAEKILRELFARNFLPYESGRRLAQLYIRDMQPDKARTLLNGLRRSYPAEADFAILAVQAAADSGDTTGALDELHRLPRAWQERSDALKLKVRILSTMGRSDAASQLLDSAAEAGFTHEHATRQSGLQTASILRLADSLAASGKHAEAERLLRPLWEQTADRYEAGVRLGRCYLALHDYDQAHGVYSTLAATYPAERDFSRLAVQALAAKGEHARALAQLDTIPSDPATEALRGRLLYRMGDLNGAQRAFRSSLAGQESAEVRKELVAAETAAELARADSLASSGDVSGAAHIWHELELSGRDTYTAGYRLAMADLRQRNYEGACQRLSQLALRYPQDSGFRHLYIESLILNGEEHAARQAIEALAPPELIRLAKERPDLLYRVRRNSLRLAGGLYGYSGNRPTEENLGATLSQRIGPVTAVLSGSRTRRFGLTDSQVGMEVHATLGKNTGRYGYLAATISPDASFLPRYTIGGELYQGWRAMEGSLGLFRQSFRKSDAHILIPGMTLYPTDTLSVNERVFVVLDSGAFTSLTTFSWEPDHRFRGSYSFGIGTAAERFSSSEDTTRYFTLTNRITAEYRLTPAISVGGEFVHEYRDGLYTRAGGILFARYWW